MSNLNTCNELCIGECTFHSSCPRQTVSCAKRRQLKPYDDVKPLILAVLKQNKKSSGQLSINLSHLPFDFPRSLLNSLGGSKFCATSRSIPILPSIDLAADSDFWHSTEAAKDDIIADFNHCAFMSHFYWFRLHSHYLLLLMDLQCGRCSLLGLVASDDLYRRDYDLIRSGVYLLNPKERPAPRDHLIPP